MLTEIVGAHGRAHLQSDRVNALWGSSECSGRPSYAPERVWILGVSESV
jgi:hypothetical protein